MARDVRNRKAAAAGRSLICGIKVPGSVNPKAES
jgi:hypothetical protein